MFILYTNNNQLTVQQRELVTSGSINVYHVCFAFSAGWNGLTRTAVFRAGTESRSVLLGDINQAVIPWEVLQNPGVHLYAGVYGTQGGHTVLPTIWADLGVILEGVRPGEEAQPPTPELWERSLARKGDRLAYTEDGELGLYAGDKKLSSVPIEGSGGEGGPVYQFGHGLKVSGGTVSVDAVDGFTGDNTLPVTAAAVKRTVGNIEVLLGTI